MFRGNLFGGGPPPPNPNRNPLFQEEPRRGLFGNHQATINPFGRNPSPNGGNRSFLFCDSNTFDPTSSSLWPKIPSEVKELFDAQKLKEKKLQFSSSMISSQCLKHPFEKKNISLFNSCTNTSNKFYNCFTCQKSQNQNDKRSQFGICEDCFEESEHEGHIYEEQLKRSNNLFGYSNHEKHCMCGKDAFFNQTQKSSILRCKKHVAKCEQQNDLPYDLQRFVDFFSSLYKLLYSVRKQRDTVMAQEIKIVNNTILNLIRDSSQNCRVFTSFATKETVESEGSRKGLFSNNEPKCGEKLPIIFIVARQCNQILKVLVKDDECLKMIAECVAKNVHLKSYFSRQIMPQILHHISAIQIIMKEKAYDLLNVSLIRIFACYSQNNLPYFLEFVQFTEKNITFLEWCKNCVELLAPIKISELLRFIAPYLLPKLLKGFYLFVIKEEYEEKDGDEDSNSDRERNTRQQQIEGTIFVTIIARMIFSLAKTDTKMVIDFRNISQPLMNFAPNDPPQIRKQQRNNEQKEQNEEKQQKQQNEEKQQKNTLQKKQEVVKEQKKSLKQIEQQWKKSFDVSCDNFYSLLEEYLRWCIQNYSTNLRGSFSNSLKLLTHLLLVRSANKQSYLQQFLKHLCPENNIFSGGNTRSLFDRQDQQLEFNDYSNIMSSLRICMLSRIYMTRYEKNMFRDEKEIQHHQQYRRQKLLEFFYEVKVFTPQKLQISKTFFNIPDFNELVKEHLVFNVDNEMFFYNEKTKFPNRLMYLFNDDQGKVRNSSNRNEVKSYFTLNCQKSFSDELKDEVQRQCFVQIFLKSNLFEKLMNRVKEAIEKDGGEKQKYVRCNFGSKIVQLIVIIYLLSEGNHEGARQEVEKMKADPSHLQKYISLGSKEIIENILCIQKQIQPEGAKDEEEVQKTQKPIDEALKEKAEQKKKEKYEKMKEKQSKAIQKLQTDSLSRVPSEEGDFCIICREKSKKNNQLVYLAKAVSNYTLSTCLYEKNNKMKTHIESCFHAIHVECYLKREKKLSMTRSQSCTLCGKSANCILPERYDPKEKKILRICMNSIISVFFAEFETYDIENLFILMLKHLVESKTFLTLTNSDKYQQNNRKKYRIDMYIEDFIHKMYQSATKEEKESYDESISLLLDELEFCEDETYKKTQQIIVKSFVEKFSTGIASVDITALKDLAGKMEAQQFCLIKCQIEQIGISFTNEQQFNLKEIYEKNEEGVKREKIGKNFPIKPPQYAHQLSKFGNKHCHFCKTSMRETMCLICGFELCNRCEGSKNHLKFHQDKILSFIYQEALLQFQNFNSQGRSNAGLFGDRSGHVNEKVNLYFTDLMIPYCDRDASHQKEVFKLNDAVFAKFYSQF